MALPAPEGNTLAHHGTTTVQCGTAKRVDVRFGSEADIAARPDNVRYTPESGPRNRPRYQLRRTNSGSLRVFAAIRRALSLVSSLPDEKSSRLCHGFFFANSPAI
jgi:hypothetical protein